VPKFNWGHTIFRRRALTAGSIASCYGWDPSTTLLNIFEELKNSRIECNPAVVIFDGLAEGRKNRWKQLSVKLKSLSERVCMFEASRRRSFSPFVKTLNKVEV
jgi:hypothetical protein